MTNNEIVAILQEQDKILKEIFAKREELAELVKSKGIYDEVWEALYADGEQHYTF